MSARYERVRLDDDDHSESPTSTSPPSHAIDIPNSPPPSFHSRASSLSRRQHAGNQSQSQSPSQTVDPALADAFGNADGDSDSDSDSDADPTVADDRRRLMRSRDALRPLRQPPTQPPQSSSSTPPPSSTTPSTTAAQSGRVYGGGIQSDGVFSNLVARPDTGEEKEELPPTYEQAAADAAPPYWETTILAPGLGGLDEVYVDGMPVGSIFSFIWNGMISMSFQVVGFLLTYLLHSTHAAKNGSRAGLGITLIQYGFYMRSSGDETPAPGGNGGMSAAGAAAAGGKTTEGFAAPPDPNAHSFDPGSVTPGGGSSDNGLADFGSSEWVAYVVMIVGWFVLIKAVSDYYRARRHEQLVLQSPDRGLGVAVIAEGESAERVV
ncbi:metal homeostatis protein bsd2 [Ophiostoma piceae UAMH 11346]|uniref:Metal homeostatis protein bsd2 n=1 Tax=Ophiostoma piceae (strain UAMH 11346) TaxID=1262450 RepID=S3CDJ8_OPHP1|nr:metal homeostatis protein bsd2 [Ophiostoma piceae UAMH 11346]